MLNQQAQQLVILRYPSCVKGLPSFNVDGIVDASANAYSGTSVISDGHSYVRRAPPKRNYSRREERDRD